MPSPHDVLFRTLADPTRRAIFERLCREGDQTVSALTAHENPRSARLLRALGFSLEGSLREFAFWKGAFHDMHMFSLLRHDPPTEEVMASLG